MNTCVMCAETCSETEGSVCYLCSPVTTCASCGQDFRSLFCAHKFCQDCRDVDYDDDNFNGGDIEDDIDSEMDESMDGDFDSAMASAGFGTDEDYGYYGSGE